MKKFLKQATGIISAIAIVAATPMSSLAEITEYNTGDYDDALYRMGGYDATYDPNYDCSAYDTQDTKWLLKENFTYGNDTVGVRRYYRKAVMP